MEIPSFFVIFVVDMIENKIYTKSDLEKMTTRQLVDFIAYNRSYGSYEWQYGDYKKRRLPESVNIPNREDYILIDSEWDDNVEKTWCWANETELREILKSRPNIPNKTQARRSRQKAAAESRRSSKKVLKYKK